MLSPCHGCYALILVLLFSSFPSYFLSLFRAFFFTFSKWNHISWESRIKQTTVWQKAVVAEEESKWKKCQMNYWRVHFAFLCARCLKVSYSNFFPLSRFLLKLFVPFSTQFFCFVLQALFNFNHTNMYVNINIFTVNCVIDNNIRYRCLFPTSFFPFSPSFFFFLFFFFYLFSAFYFTLFFFSFAFSYSFFEVRTQKKHTQIMWMNEWTWDF